MSSLLRRMQRMAARDSRGAKKHAITWGFATKLGVHNPKAKNLLTRQARKLRPVERKTAIVPHALRRSKKSQARLAGVAVTRKAKA